MVIRRALNRIVPARLRLRKFVKRFQTKINPAEHPEILQSPRQRFNSTINSNRRTRAFRELEAEEYERLSNDPSHVRDADVLIEVARRKEMNRLARRIAGNAPGPSASQIAQRSHALFSEVFSVESENPHVVRNQMVLEKMSSLAMGYAARNKKKRMRQRTKKAVALLKVRESRQRKAGN